MVPIHVLILNGPSLRCDSLGRLLILMLSMIIRVGVTTMHAYWIQHFHQRPMQSGPFVLRSRPITTLLIPQIETNLSHDGLNPTHVDLSLTNSQTLGNDFTARMI